MLNALENPLPKISTHTESFKLWLVGTIPHLKLFGLPRFSPQLMGRSSFLSGYVDPGDHHVMALRSRNGTESHAV